MPDQITQLLGQIDRLDQQATKGPWEIWEATDDDGTIYPECMAGPKNELFGARGWDDTHYIQEIPELTMEDAHFIALSRTAMPALAQAVRAVLDLHKPFHDDHYYNGMDGETLHRFVLRCAGCYDSGGIEDCPCPTVQAIQNALGDADA